VGSHDTNSVNPGNPDKCIVNKKNRCSFHPTDVDDNRAQGKDERIGVKEFYDGLEYIYEITKAFSSTQ
jgi:hypothetical protein